MKRALVVALGAILWLAGCAGDERRAATTPADEPIDLGPGLGEASPPDLRAGWKTDFTRHTVPLSQFRSGGPGKDGIPAITRPRFVEPASADYLARDEPVIEVVVNGDARAYPIQILIWHEIVNDTIGGVPVAVTFCPLCNTALVFDRRMRGRTLEFGTTGNLRNSDLVMYDRGTESWWQQFGGAGLVGFYAGARLRALPAPVVAWSEFAARHPNGRVLSRSTGYDRPYGQNPYPGYDDVASSPIFPAANADDRRLHPKERVVFVEHAGEAVAVPFASLQARRVVRVRLGGDELVVRWRPGVRSSLDAEEIADGRDVGSASATLNGRPVPFDQPFWFAVAAFRPDVRIVG